MDKEEEYKLEEEQVVMGLDLDEEDEDIKDLIFQLEKQDDDDIQEDQDDDDDDDDDELPKSTRWYDRDTCKVVNGVEVVPNKRKRGERDDLDLCSICLKPWTMDKLHQLSCLPCGHVFGMSCIKEWMEGRSSHKCPQCYQLFSFKSARLLYATRLCIPADQKESIRRFPYNKQGFTAFKQYQRELLTNAFNNRSHALKQRAHVLARQKDAMKRRTELLNRMANTQKRAEALACLAGAEKQEALRCRADALGQRADEYLRKADAFGQQAKALRQRAKASRQRVGAYIASMQFYKQSYKELLGLHDIRSQMDMEEDHKPMEANKEYKQEEEQHQEQQQEQEERQEQEQEQEQEEKEQEQEQEQQQQQQPQQQQQVDMDLDLDEMEDEDDDDDDDDDDDEDDDVDDGDEDEDEVDDKETSLLPKATSWIDVYSGKTVDGLEVPSKKRKRDEEEEEIVDGAEVPSKKRKRDEEEQQAELELDLDDNNDDVEQVEEMTLPLVISRIDNGKTVHEIEVPVMKDDDFIDDSMYRDDHELTDSQKDFAEALDSRPPKIQAKAPDVCPICFKHWTGDQIHRVCCLPCGHIFGASCIKKWLQTDLHRKCPQCNVFCSLEDVRPLYATSFRIPAAEKGAEDQKTFTRRFPLCNLGIIAFHKLETARRNVALKKWRDAKKRLAGVLERKNEAMKCRTDLLDRMKALEQQGGSLCRADALGTLADEYLRQAKVCEGRAKALRQMAKAYNQRVNALLPRLAYFGECCDNIFKLG